MGHGDRWDAYLSDQGGDRLVDEIVMPLIQGGVRSAGPLRQYHIPAQDDEPEVWFNGPIQCYSRHEGPAIVSAYTLIDPLDGSTQFMTAYPMPTAAVVHSVQIAGVEEDCVGVEGWITATIGQTIIHFFAADYYTNFGRYQVGATLPVRLGAIAYSAASPRRGSFTVADERRLMPLVAAGILEPGSREMRVIMGGFAPSTSPWGSPQPFEVTYRGTVRQRERVHGLRDDYWQLLVTLFVTDDDRNIDIDILVADHVIKGRAPQVGDGIEGALAIMGCLADHQWPAPRAVAAAPARSGGWSGLANLLKRRVKR
jgi:hypothetical protein